MIIKGRMKAVEEDKFDHWVTWDNIISYRTDSRIEKPKNHEEYLENKIIFDTKEGTLVLSVYDFDELYVMNDDGKTFETLRCIDARIIRKLR